MDENVEEDRLFVDTRIPGKEAVDVFTWTNAALIRLLKLQKKCMKRRKDQKTKRPKDEKTKRPKYSEGQRNNLSVLSHEINILFLQ